MNLRDQEDALAQMHPDELWMVWQIVGTEAIRQGFVEKAVCHATRIVEAQRDDGLTKTDILKQIIDSILDLKALVTEQLDTTPWEYRKQ